MYKEILNEEAVYYGGVNCPKGYEIHREQIKYAMMYGYLEKSKNKKTPVQPLNHTIHLSFLNSYISDFFKLQQKGKSSLVTLSFLSPSSIIRAVTFFKSSLLSVSPSSCKFF